MAACFDNVFVYCINHMYNMNHMKTKLQKKGSDYNFHDNNNLYQIYTDFKKIV